MKVRVVKDKTYARCLVIQEKLWWLPFWRDVEHTFEGLEEAVLKAQRRLNYPETAWEGEK